MQKSLMWAFGSNLNHAHMRARCPNATPIKGLYIDHAKLVFRSVADVMFERGAIAAGGLWEITKECEERLDRYEGVASGLYSKLSIRLLYRGEERDCLFYQMNEEGVMPPSNSYLGIIRQGYRDFGLDERLLNEAVDEAWHNQYRTPYLQNRFKRSDSQSIAHPRLGSRVCEASNRKRLGRLQAIRDDTATVKWNDGEVSKLPVHRLRVAARLQTA